MIAEEVRMALKIIGELTGEITSEELLQEIFGKFCIGK
jgi:tRNA modification GTPase